MTPNTARLTKGTHVFIEGELTYGEYNRTIESESGALNVQWPVTEIVVESIKVLDRKRKENDEREGGGRLAAASFHKEDRR